MSDETVQESLGLQPETTEPELPLRESEEIQGNILAGFNKDHVVFLFFKLPDALQGRAYLLAVVPRIATTKQVTTFNAQFSNARRLRGGDDPTNLRAVWVNISLTHHGLLTVAPGLRPELRDFFAFNRGPVAQADSLGDVGMSAPNRWLFGGSGQPDIDVMLTIAADDTTDLETEVARQRALAAQHGLLMVFEERGDTLPGDRAGHEHFGFKDGISQPGVKGFHAVNPDKPTERLGHPGTEMIAAGEFVLGHVSESGVPPIAPDWMANGSFNVHRRLSQDVAGFWAQVLRNKASLPPNDPLSADALAAKTVGRWRSGTPLAHAPDRDNRSAQDVDKDNDFKFEDDLEGIKTPLFAHIRKMYPRDHDRHADKFHRIIRRGIPFGAPFDPTNGRGHGVDADRGLIFNVYMASIESGFEFLQTAWANSASFPDGDAGPDPVIGDAPSPVRLRREGMPDMRLDFRRFVHTSGAIYAFAPSLSTLRRIGRGELGAEAPPPPILRVGGRAEVKRDGNTTWRLRSQPSLSGRVIVAVAGGTIADIIGGPQQRDGHEWWRLRLPDGREGWMSAIGLIPLEE
jgi:Dyp-type peroxidase family